MCMSYIYLVISIHYITFMSSLFNFCKFKFQREHTQQRFRRLQYGQHLKYKKDDNTPTSQLFG